jgi:thioredoxin-like negative regulator of GroEL
MQARSQATNLPLLIAWLPQAAAAQLAGVLLVEQRVSQALEALNSVVRRLRGSWRHTQFCLSPVHSHFPGGC